MVAIFLNFVGFIVLIKKVFFKAEPPVEDSILNIITQDYKEAFFIINILFFIISIYIFIFVDSLHKSIKEFRNRYYVVAKL